MEQGDYDRACTKFEQSRKLDPSSGGGGTMLNLALCQELAGRTGTAWAHFRTALSLAIRDRRQDRQAFAESHIAALAPRLLRLRVVVPPAARLPGLVVFRGGLPLGEGEWGDALVVDPGELVVEARAPGRTSYRQFIRLDGEGISTDLIVPVLPLAPQDVTGGTEPGPDPTMRMAGIFVGGAGLAAIAVGGVFGVQALNRQSEADELCPNYDHCNPAGISLSADAANYASVATASFIGGAILLTTGVVLFLTAPTSRHAPPPAAKAKVTTSGALVTFDF